MTNAMFNGNLGGLAGADAKCADAASQAGLTGSFKAWLSTSGGTPLSRFTQSTVPYVLTNGVQIASNWADLVDGVIDNPINVSATGQTIASGFAWTNTTSAGSAKFANPSLSCSGFTQAFASDPGPVGINVGTLQAWTDHSTRTCNLSSHLMCFQQ